MKALSLKTRSLKTRSLKAWSHSQRAGAAGLLLIALFTAGGLAGCSDQAPETTTNSDETATVEVAETVAWTHPTTRQLPGVVSPGERALLSTRVAGTLTSVPAAPGDAVAKGELLATVDAREVEAAIAAARENVTAAEAAVAQARLNSQRLHRLYDEDLIARVRTEQADVKLSELKAQRQAAQSELKAQRANLDYTRITAPFAGHVSETLMDAGSFVGPGQPIVALEQRHRLNIDVPVSREQADILTAGQRLAVLMGGERIAEARLVSVIPALSDQGTGQRLRLSVETPPARLVPGHVVSVTVPIPPPKRQQEHTTRVGVPQEALIRRGQLTGVLVVEASTDTPTLQLRWIKTATPPAGADNLIPVTQGLAVGERVVLNPVPSLRDGQAVSLQSTAQRPEEK